ncbi:hypothetical protein ABFX02_09G098800 [Erythranthe guttata]
MESYKQTKVFITMLVMMAIFSTSVAENYPIDGNLNSASCIRTCISKCQNSPDIDRCIVGCSRGCIPRTAIPNMPSSYYCTIGCSLRRSPNAANGIELADGNMLLRCLDECSKVDDLKA